MLTPEDRRIRKQWAFWVAGVYSTVALALFIAASAIPSSDPPGARTQISAAAHVSGARLIK